MYFFVFFVVHPPYPEINEHCQIFISTSGCKGWIAACGTKNTPEIPLDASAYCPYCVGHQNLF